jgi:two-component system NtrC family sensor kinase
VSGPGSVLVVDSDEGSRESLGAILRRKGYAVETAGTGRAGLERMRAHPVDAVIVDVRLPDLAGPRLIREMRKVVPHFEAIFLAGHASLQSAIQAIDGAAFAYLTKPVESDHLLSTLERALEKRRLARDLHEALERYRLITENVSDAIFLLDAEGRLDFQNRRALEITGYAAGELRGRPFLSLFPAEEGREARARLAAAREGTGAVPLFEAPLLRKDGGRTWVEVSFAAVRKGGGSVAGLAVARDVSERKRLQEQLIQAEKTTTLGQLVSGIAHELNNPLSAMVGHAQLLRLGEEDPKKAARADRVIEAAQRATRIVRDFLTFVRKRPPEKTAVAVNDVVTRTLGLLAYPLRVNTIEVETLLAPRLPPVAGDPQQIQQVLLNLIQNAIEAMVAARGRGRLRVASAPGPDGATVQVTVADDGPGIAPSDLPRIFEPFFTTKPPGRGTGLGLAIALGIVTEHGGTLTAESEPGRGATFTLSLPVAPASPPPAPPPAAPAAPRGMRVLVVDDEVALCEMMAEALRGRGHEVLTARSGREALQVLEGFPADALVLDVRMPEMSGMELWARVREANPGLARRTLFCTGDVVGEESREFLDRTDCPMVSKPFDLHRFVEAVARAAARA